MCTYCKTWSDLREIYCCVSVCFKLHIHFKRVHSASYFDGYTDLYTLTKQDLIYRYIYTCDLSTGFDIQIYKHLQSIMYVLHHIMMMDIQIFTHLPKQDLIYRYIYTFDLSQDLIYRYIYTCDLSCWFCIIL